MKNRGKKSYLNSEISTKEKKNTKLNENDTITHRIIQYFDDPKEARALAKIREVSQGAKMNSNESLPRINVNLDSIEQNAPRRNSAEKRKVRFREPKKNEKIKKNGKFSKFSKKNEKNEEDDNTVSSFIRRRFKFNTQKHNKKIVTIIIQSSMKGNKNKFENNN